MSDSSKWFTLPRPLKVFFDKFPAVTYGANDLPEALVRNRPRNALYIFTTDAGVEAGRPSFNPGCLKWQTYLKFAGVDFLTVKSNNHASPSGALPFLIPSLSPSVDSKAASPIPSSKLERWAKDRWKDTGAQQQAEPGGMRYEAYMSLLDHRIRNAWLYTLYLSPKNFASIVRPLYIDSCTSNPTVRYILAHDLRVMAEAELLKQSAVVDVEALYRECDAGFASLSELLGTEDWFFGGSSPGIFDASIFAYTHVLLDSEIDWRDTRMREILKKYENLIQHHERIYTNYFE